MEAKLSGRSLKVLVVDDERAMREVLELRLGGWGFEVTTADTAERAEKMVAQAAPDVVLCDVVMPGISGIELLERLKDGDAGRPVIMMTAHGSVDDAVEAMKRGADDFLTKPIDSEHLRAVLEALAGRLGDLRPASDELAEPQLEEGPGGMVGASPVMHELFALVRRAAPNEADVLIHGESGTGKELVARAIHALSPRHAGPFVPVNAAATPESLTDSHYFGHEKGSFTGASQRREGYFEQAHGGTLFLDEITEMPMNLQPKLLRVLEERRVTRVGGSREVVVDLRVVAATNRDPVQAVDDGLLREDLFYRLNVFPIRVPPLRERPGDIDLLVRHFVASANARHGTTVRGLTEAAQSRLAEHAWPGNVRELRNVVERGVILAAEGLLGEAHLPHFLSPRARTAGDGLVIPRSATVAEAERLLILDTLQRVGNNKAEAARQLGIDVKTVRNKLRLYEQTVGGG